MYGIHKWETCPYRHTKGAYIICTVQYKYMQSAKIVLCYFGNTQLTKRNNYLTSLVTIPSIISSTLVWSAVCSYNEEILHVAKLTIFSIIPSSRTSVTISAFL